MPVDLSWYLDDRILCARVYGKLSGRDDECYDAIILDYLKGSNGLPIHIITDYSRLEVIESEIKVMNGNADLFGISKHPALGLTVACGTENPMFRYLNGLTSYALKPSIHRVATVEDAINFLCQKDSTLQGMFPINISEFFPSYLRPA